MISSTSWPSSPYPSLPPTPQYSPSCLSPFPMAYCHNYPNYSPLDKSCCSYTMSATKILLCWEWITKTFSATIFACTSLHVPLLSRRVSSQRESSTCLLNSHTYSQHYLTFSISSTMSIMSCVEGFSPIRINTTNTASIIHLNLYSNQSVIHRLSFICFLITFSDAQTPLIYKLTQSKPCTFSSSLCKKKTPT